LPTPAEPAQLALAANQRRVEAARKGRRFLVQREQAVRDERFALALQLERLGRLGHDRVANELRRLGAKQDLACLRGLLQPRGDVHRVAGRQALGRADDDLAGADADAAADADLGQRLSHLHGRANGAKRVVLVHLRNAEDGHHRVADELLHCAAVPLDDRLHLAEVAAEQRAQCLRVGGLAERGRADDVAEEHRHDLAVLAWGGLLCQLRAAGVAEP
jgi:hypothetical protein